MPNLNQKLTTSKAENESSVPCKNAPMKISEIWSNIVWKECRKNLVQKEMSLLMTLFLEHITKPFRCTALQPKFADRELRFIEHFRPEIPFKSNAESKVNPMSSYQRTKYCMRTMNVFNFSAGKGENTPLLLIKIPLASHHTRNVLK